MPEMSDLRAAHRALIAKISQLVTDFERETGLRVETASVVRDGHDLKKILWRFNDFAAEDHETLLTDERGKGYLVWIVPHAEV